METTTIKYGAGGQRKTALLFLGIGVIGLAFVYYSWFMKNDGVIFGRYTSIFITLLGFGAFLKLTIWPKKADAAALIISQQGISSFTTPIARAIGLVAWDDIQFIHLEKNILHIILHDPKKYSGKIKNFFVRDTFLKTKEGAIPVSILEIDSTAPELTDILRKYPVRLNR